MTARDQAARLLQLHARTGDSQRANADFVVALHEHGVDIVRGLVDEIGRLEEAIRAHKDYYEAGGFSMVTADRRLWAALAAGSAPAAGGGE